MERFNELINDLNTTGLTALLSGMEQLNSNGIRIPIDFTGVIYKSPEYYDLTNKLNLLYKFQIDLRTSLHNCSPPEGNDIFVERSALPIKVNSVECKPSRTHGKGVFATRNIRRGEVITFYPADVIMIKTMFEDRQAYRFKFNDRMCRKYNVINGESTLAGFDWIDYYLLDYSNNIQFSGNPELCDDSTYLGHMCNDAAVCPPEEKDGGARVYARVVMVRVNAEFIMDRENLIAAVVAYKDINQGEEIFVPYGPEYWYRYHRGEMNFDSINAEYSDMRV